MQKSRLSGRDRKFSATSLKILFARIDRGSDRVKRKKEKKLNLNDVV